MKNYDGVRWPRQLRHSAGSLVIVIPRKLCRALGLYAGNYLNVQQRGNEIVITRINLGQDSPLSSQHHQVPAGRHGDWMRKEQAAAALRPGEADPSPANSKPS